MGGSIEKHLEQQNNPLHALILDVQVELVDRVPYSSLQLRLGGLRVFPALQRLGDISYLALVQAKDKEQ